MLAAFHYAGDKHSPYCVKALLMKKEVQTGRPSQRATFADVARMIAPSNAPPWLPAHLEWWAQGIRHDILVDQYRPSKLQTVERLLGVEQAVAVLRHELEDPNIRNFLVTAKMAKRIGISIADLKDLSERSLRAFCAPRGVSERRK
jgi:hypothetical protein